MPFAIEVGLGPGDIMLDGYPAPPEKGTAAPTPTLLANVYCGQAPVWIKMTFGTEIRLGRVHIS